MSSRWPSGLSFAYDAGLPSQVRVVKRVGIFGRRVWFRNRYVKTRSDPLDRHLGWGMGVRLERSSPSEIRWATTAHDMALSQEARDGISHDAHVFCHSTSAPAMTALGFWPLI